MSKHDEPKPEEIVLRGLLRLPEELDPETGRPHQDRDDFIRRRVYQKNGPENGLSVFRRCKYPTNEAFYNRIGSRKPMGTSECTLSDLTGKDIKHIVSGDDNDHLSLRCPDCNMASKPDICKPVSGASFDDCPFFEKTDPLDLNTSFKETEAPKKRVLAPKAAKATSKEPQ
jgi:hypothetical protein